MRDDALTSSAPASVFESTIRYIGGLLASYELSGSVHHALVDRAQELADKLAFAWLGVSYIVA